MRYRTLGKTNLIVSEIGFGAWGIGGEMWQGGNDAQSVRALHAGADLGITFFDTALAYGEGHSEQLVGRFVKERKEKIIVATKIPPKNRIWPAQPGSKLSEVFPHDYIIECTEQSLRNLKMDTIEIMQLHVWLDEWSDQDEWKKAFEKLKKEGKVHRFGISVNDHQPGNALRAAATGLIDTLQVIYNIFDQSPEEELFPFCQQHNIGIIVRVPFDEGALTGLITPETTFPEGDWRNGYFKDNRKTDVHRHITSLRRLLGAEADSLPELALRFCLHHPAVSTVIAGMRSEKNVRKNCSVSDGRPMSRELLAELKKEAWRKNYYS